MRTHHLGKLLGALLGVWIFRHPLGALPGLLAGHWFDQRLRVVRVPPVDSPQQGRSDQSSTSRSADFDTLGLRSNATPEEIEQAWRRLMARHHPDRATEIGRAEAEQRCGEINAAYRRLRRRRAA